MLPDGMLEDVMTRLGMRNIYERNDADGNRWVNASCPLAPYSDAHQGLDDNPSFGVIDDSESGSIRCNCYTCKYNGTFESLIYLLGIYHGTDYTGMITEITLNKFGKGFQPWDSKPKYTPPPSPLQITSRVYMPVTAHQPAVDYLKKRGINGRAAKIADLRYTPHEERVILPVRDFDKKLYGFASRTILSKEDYPVLPDGKKMPKTRDFHGLKKRYFILGSEHWVKGKPSLIIEGLIGYLYLLSIGADTYFNIGATMGNTLTQYQADKLIAWGEAVYMLYDFDTGGVSGLIGSASDKNPDLQKGALSKLFKMVPLYVPEWPFGKNDPDQLTIEDVKEFLNTPFYNGDKKLVSDRLKEYNLMTSNEV